MTLLMNVPFLNPFKFLPNTANPGIHFDDSWAFEQIKSFETKVKYYQKWQVGDTTSIQIEASTIPDDLKVYCGQTVKKTIAWTKKADGAEIGISIYEAIFDISDLDVNKIYYLYIKSGTFEAISEPIYSKTSWPNTLLFTYRNSDNNFGVAFTTGVEFSFRCEAGIMDFNPENEDANYVDQIHNVEELSGTPFRTFKLYIGDEKGVAPWVLDVLNRIFVCDYVDIEGLQYSKNTGAKWDPVRVKPWPLMAGSLEIVPTKNASGLQFETNDDSMEGMVTAYDIDTNFFGTEKEDEYIIDYNQS